MEDIKIWQLIVLPSALPTVVLVAFCGVINFQLNRVIKKNEKLNDNFFNHLNKFHSKTEKEREAWIPFYS